MSYSDFGHLQEFESVELHKLTHYVNQIWGGGSFFHWVEKYHFLKTKQWHNCSLCAHQSWTAPHIGNTDGAECPTRPSRVQVRRSVDETPSTWSVAAWSVRPVVSCHHPQLLVRKK